MKSSEYWKKAALLREIAVQEGATATAEDVLKLYDEALDDINNEIAVIKANFQRRYGLDNETASYFLTQAQQDENLAMLIKALEEAPTEKARQDILEYIHLDGLSVRAYASRIERYNAVKQSIYARVKKLATEQTALVTGMLKKAYSESYYGNIDDTAKGLNMGISFGILNDDAINEAITAKWHGKRFSERIWNNTDRLAQEAQELVTKSLMSGESLTKTSKKLAETFQVEKYHATTLVHTETAHIHAMADMKAYEDLGIEEYKYLATLDYRTCEMCQPLDGKVFKRSEAIEGVNYPTMHPRCRCTTTMNIDFNARRARNPLTGKNEIVDGNMTYSEWIKSLTPEQKAALELSRKKDANRTADKLQKKVPVDKSGGNGIINMRGGSVALENQRYGRNKDTLVNKTYIESGEYRRKFDKISDNKDVNKTLYECAKTALKHRSGTKFEDMYWIDGNSGKIIASALNEKYESGIVNSASRNKILSRYDNIYAIHTHPASMPPSAADFNSQYKNNYKCGYIACHNGKVFGYTANEEINERLCNAYAEDYMKDGCSEFEAQIRALEKLKENNDIDFWEVK